MEKVNCSICGRKMPGSPREWPQFPFCSERCKTIDLGRWLDGSYSLEAEEPDELELDSDQDSEDSP